MAFKRPVGAPAMTESSHRSPETRESRVGCSRRKDFRAVTRTGARVASVTLSGGGTREMIGGTRMGVYFRRTVNVGERCRRQPLL